MKNDGVHGTSAKATYYTLVSTNTDRPADPRAGTELASTGPPAAANGKGQTSTVDGIHHRTPYLSAFERRIGATLIIPARHVLLALRLRRELADEPFTGMVWPTLGSLGLHSGYSIIPLYEMAGRAAPRKFCQALLI
jgi:hypothetical protein